MEGPPRQPAVEWEGGQPKEQHCLVHESNSSRGPKKSLWRIFKKCPQGKRVSVEHFSLVEKEKCPWKKRAWNHFETISVQVKSTFICFSFALPFSKTSIKEELVGEKKTRTPLHTSACTHTHTHCKRLGFTVGGRKSNIQSTSESWPSSGTRWFNS